MPEYMKYGENSQRNLLSFGTVSQYIAYKAV